MALDTLSTRQRQLTLFERYGPLLTDQQRKVLDLHLRQDWSLGEIARLQGTSRAAVHDLIRRAHQSLDAYEARLKLVAERTKVARQLAILRRQLENLEARI